MMIKAYFDLGTSKKNLKTTLIVEDFERIQL